MSRPVPALLAAVLGAVLPLAGGRPAGAAAGDRITGLVAGGSRLFALRGNTVVTFDRAGREIARCARFEAPPPRATRTTPGPIDAQEALRWAGLPDDDFQSAEAEEVLASEGLAPRKRRPGLAEAPIVARMVASSPAADDVWIATSAGLFRGRDGACTRVALPGRDVIAVAVAGGAIAAATEDLLWLSGDGGRTFRVAAGLTARPRALALVDDVRTLVASDDGVIQVGPHGTVRAVLPHGCAAVAVCGGVALALAGGDAWSWRGDDAPARAGDRPPARVLACGGGPDARFLAAGDDVFASADGAAWRALRGVPGRSAAAVAIGEQIWLAAEDVVVAIDGPPTASVDPIWDGAPTPALPPLPTRRLAEPAFPWPQLSIVYAAQHTPLRDGWSVVALVVFRLGRTTVARGDGLRLAAEIVRRDAALAAEEIGLAAAVNDDPSRSARLRALRQEREALR
jgi:hypothetical protein